MKEGGKVWCNLFWSFITPSCTPLTVHFLPTLVLLSCKYLAHLTCNKFSFELSHFQTGLVLWLFQIHSQVVIRIDSNSVMSFYILKGTLLCHLFDLFHMYTAAKSHYVCWTAQLVELHRLKEAESLFIRERTKNVRGKRFSELFQWLYLSTGVPVQCPGSMGLHILNIGTESSIVLWISVFL